jgi:ParB family chromosome partitioning protein
MSKRAGGWKRQSWQDAEREIGQAVGLTVQTTDQVALIPDEQVEDSPYQARVGYDDSQIADLAQGMRETGFQGVLFVRAHPGGPEGGRPRYQLVFGHRRRRAWRVVCAERNTPCALPAIVREVSDRQLLTIGAQENLQREDLNPLEEAQLVLWHQELYYPAGLGEIGRMLGKSEDWAKVRSRVAQLPEPLKAKLRRSPQLMTGVLEISRLWERNPATAQALAEQAEREGLTLKQIRASVAEMMGEHTPREIIHDRRVNAPIVNDFTEGAAIEGAEGKPILTGARTVTLRTPQQRISEETDRMLTQLRLWEQLVMEPALREPISTSCERLLRQLQRLVETLEGDGHDKTR